MLNERSLMNKIIEFRTYQKPSSNSKTIEANIHKEKMRLKSEYMLPQRPKKIENNTNKLWNFLERGGNNE